MCGSYVVPGVSGNRKHISLIGDHDMTTLFQRLNSLFRTRNHKRTKSRRQRSPLRIVERLETRELMAADIVPSVEQPLACSLETTEAYYATEDAVDSTPAGVSQNVLEDVTLMQRESNPIPLAAKYQVTVEGKVNGKSFTVSGYLEVKGTMNEVTWNGINPRDVFLKLGNPLGNPKAGALWLATNNGFFDRFGYYDADQKIDLARVKMNSADRTLTTRIDGELVASGLNRFNDRGGVTAPMFSVTQGGLDLKFSKSGDSLSGKVSVKGVSHYLPVIPGLPVSSIHYQATIRGERIR